MPRPRVMSLWRIAAAALPLFAACAAHAAPTAPTPDAQVSPPNPVPAAAPSVPSQGLRLNSPPSEATSKVSQPASALRSAGARFDLAERAAGAAALDLTPVNYPSRTGWHISGRAGPMRWVTPLAADGTTILRLGGSVPGQPRMPGMGTYNISVHDAF